jgi:hypothetical protein
MYSGIYSSVAFTDCKMLCTVEFAALLLSQTVKCYVQWNLQLCCFHRLYNVMYSGICSSVAFTDCKMFQI